MTGGGLAPDGVEFPLALLGAALTLAVTGAGRFSLDALLANLAVIVAAGFVAWTGTPWPDLVVAAVIAGLFLHSAWAIIRDTRSDLREAAA